MGTTIHCFSACQNGGFIYIARRAVTLREKLSRDVYHFALDNVLASFPGKNEALFSGIFTVRFFLSVRRGSVRSSAPHRKVGCLPLANHTAPHRRFYEIFNRINRIEPHRRNIRAPNRAVGFTIISENRTEPPRNIHDYLSPHRTAP